MTLISPSEWLKKLVGQSFLREYPVEVVHNKIDTDEFQPTPGDFREKHGLNGKRVILGVATAWGEKKGLYDFIELSKRLDEDSRIVLVGLTEEQMKKVPQEILCLPRTNSKKELAEIYTAADIFLNLSKEETFGLTILEALACGTYPIVYKDTACEEVVNIYGGLAVEQSISAVAEAVYSKSEHDRKA